MTPRPDLWSIAFELVGSLVLWTAGVLLLFQLATVTAWILLWRKGWLGFSVKGPGLWLGFSLVVWLCAGFAAGSVAGVQVGVARTGVKLADEVGRTLLIDAIESIQDGIDPNVRAPVREARRWVNTIKTWRPIDDDSWAAWLLDTVLDRIRGPYVASCESYLAKLGPDEGVLPSKMAEAVWDGASAQVKGLARSYLKAAVYQSAGVLAAFIAAWTGLVSLIRGLRNRWKRQREAG